MEEELSGSGEVALDNRALFRVNYNLTEVENGRFEGTIDIVDEIAANEGEILFTHLLYDLHLRDDQVLTFNVLNIGHSDTTHYEIKTRTE